MLKIHISIDIESAVPKTQTTDKNEIFLERPVWKKRAAIRIVTSCNMIEIINQKLPKFTNPRENILAIDIATRSYRVALSPKNSKVVYEVTNEGCELEDLFFLTEQLLNKGKIKLEELETIICCRGPSSFSGIRKNLTIASALSFDSNVKILTVSDLAAQSYAAFLLNDAKTILVANDAKRGQVFFAAYQFKASDHANCIKEDSIVKPENTMASLDIDINNLCLVGDGWEKYHQKIPNRLREFPTIRIENVLPSTLISLALSYPSLLKLTHQEVDPNYLRHPVE